MGLIRFLLAAAVVLGHAPGWGHLPVTDKVKGFLSPSIAVQEFFVISGFYMALIQRRYSGLISTFYINRYSRLAVSYWIVASATLTIALLRPETSVAFAGDLKAPVVNGGRMLLALSNGSMMGQDLSSLLGAYARLPPQWLAVPASLSKGAEAWYLISHWPLIPPAWSLGTELWFYLMVPFLTPLSTRVLLLLLATSICVRIVIIGAGLPFTPWQNRFFPAELAFFLIGMLCFRAYLWLRDGGYLTRRRGWVALCLAVLFLTCSQFLPSARGLTALHSFLYAMVLFLLIPPIFHLTRDSKIDRFIGEFSYPIYLFHIGIGTFCGPAQHLWQGGFLLILSILFSVPLVLLVEVPMERWRQERLRVARQRSDGPQEPGR
jgi:peptidoglycan/LPS O-acetylase OafA/YrhL